VGEARRVLHGTIANLACFQLDPLAAVQRSHHKDLQLRLAAELGLEVPRTLVTNRAEDAIALWRELEGRVVTKMQHSFAIYREGRENVVFTTRVREGDLADLDGLRWCPMTFQEELPKRLELRVTVVGRRVVAASIDSARRAQTAVDWRRDGLGIIAEWEPFELPEAIATRLLALQQRLGLEYGAADFVLTPDDRFVFLEVNPVGEFFWLDRLPSQPISDSIAALLLGQAERNVGRDGG
jgi:glutathione synthase/RimK-type ligase-like ATP-grasp enzyme